MTNAAAHSHHSLRSIRRKLVRSALVFSSSGLLTAFGLCSRNADSFPATIHAVYGMVLGCRGQSSRAPFSSGLYLHANHHAPPLVPQMTHRNFLKDHSR